MISEYINYKKLNHSKFSDGKYNDGGIYKEIISSRFMIQEESPRLHLEQII